MIKETAEFEAYTGKVKYAAGSKRDSTYLGRFTYGMLTDFEGLNRVLTIIARGYMWEDIQNPNIDKAKEALCAWCSIPDKKKATPKDEWQFDTDFSYLNDAFPGLVDKNGKGWFYRHAHSVVRFVSKNPDKVTKSSLANSQKLKLIFDREWKEKVLQLQIPLSSKNTKGAWVLRFDDILSNALVAGPLKNKEQTLPEHLLKRVEECKDKEIPEDVILALLQYYFANKEADSDWVVLPVINFDAYLGTSSFSKKWLSKLPTELFEKQSRYGVCRYRVKVNI